MFAPDSRYAHLEVLTHSGADGREVKYVSRRFVPQAGGGTVLREHVVREADRLDHIAARYLGDPELFWQIADVNNALRADALVTETGDRLVVALLPAGTS